MGTAVKDTLDYWGPLYIVAVHSAVADVIRGTMRVEE